MRQANISRKTAETDIELQLNLDSQKRGSIKSGSAFLDHMLNLFQSHAGIELSLVCKGDTEIDFHHSMEDIAIVFGSALNQALGDKKGIERFGFYFAPMDETLARVALDYSGRIAYVLRGDLPAKIGEMESSLWEHFFKSLAENAKMNLHIELLYGQDGHHCMEAIFKAFARATAMAIGKGKNTDEIPSTKGTLNS
ncbi:MAG: imidazoleglycerol-phosphate dehydratase HisB [Fibromonadaceae bacterium]|jgi:imidazoleglycerol-phosphate dehydratase|nr:imidazoleglycerol-phosphate dehydratase HisB [Fibromonadaceae bacterium]